MCYYTAFIVRGALGFIKPLQSAQNFYFLFFFFFQLQFYVSHARAEELAIGGLGQPVAVRAAEPLRAMTCFRLRACALLYGFNYRLQTQTELLFRGA